MLLNAGQNLTEILKEKFAIKADDSFTVESALSKIKKSLFERKSCQCPAYTHLIIDFEKDTNLPMLRQIQAKLKELYSNPKLEVVS